MFNKALRWFVAAVAASLFFLPFAVAAEASLGPLVTTAWLQKNLGGSEILLIDASGTRPYAAGHIPGAINVDLYAEGIHRMTPAEIEPRLQTWGISPGKKVVIYDQGGSIMATWLFFELYHHGFPERDLVILDGGLAKWKEGGGPVTKEASPAPAKGTFRVARLRDAASVKLPEFLVASGDLARNALVNALEPEYHFGDTKFFDRSGHIPHGVMWPTADFFNADKTFKSPEEIKRMAAYLGVKPDQQVNSYCGGGVAATVPFFALKFLAGYPKVSVFKGSQMEWLRDDRGLPVWTYDAPFLRREASWLNGWGSRMTRMYGVAQLSVVDVRPADAYRQGHVPFALNVPADVFRKHMDDPTKLAALLGPAGIDPSHEAVIVSDGGLNEGAALAFVALERLGQKKVSLLLESMDDWGLQGFQLTKDATIVGAPKSPQEFAVPAASYPANARPGIVMKDARGAGGMYPRVLIASGKNLPEKLRDGKVIHVPYTELLNPNGMPKPASEIWKVLVKAGVPRYAEIICFSDEPGEAAINYFVLKLMGYPDVKMLAS